MCGIAGIYAFEGEGSVDVLALERMTQALVHRGPDDAGTYVHERVGLGHRRLSIIDVAAGHQPMANADRTIWITYNGEIFNYIALREELATRGATFATRSDTEVILHAYEIFGQKCVEHLNGQFAFAIWDARRQELFLARDRMGEKPLHYARLPSGKFVFASEAKALLQLAELRAPVSPASVAEVMLCSSLLEGRTMFAGIQELRQGHTLVVTRDGPREPSAYWDLPEPDPAAAAEDISDADAVREFDRLMKDAVVLRLMSEVPLACFLSGGIDSSLVTYWAAREQPSLRTFTLQFERQLDTNDTRHAATLSRALGTAHTEVPLKEADYYRVLDDVAWHLERPFEVSAPSLFLLYGAIHGKATVILTGEGADELAAGYYNTPGLGLARAFVEQDDSRVPWVSFQAEIESLFAPDFLRETRARDLVRESIGRYLRARATSSRGEQALYLFQKIFLCELLRTHDRVGMASSIESRAPFLDHRLVEFLSRLPLRLKVNGTTEKYLLRKSLEPISHEIAWRQKKPLPAPRGESLGRQLADVRERVLSPSSLTRQYFDESKLRRFLAREGEFSAVSPIVLYRISFALLTLEAFHRAFAARGALKSA